MQWSQMLLLYLIHCSENHSSHVVIRSHPEALAFLLAFAIQNPLPQ